MLAPDSAWLVIRGLRTLPLRMRQHQHNTYAILTFLNSRAEVENICHPLMADAKQREIVSQQMFGTSGLISFELKDGSFEKVKAIIDSCRIFKPGCSWGDMKA